MVDLTLNSLKVPDIDGYTPPFGDKITTTPENKGSLSTQQVNDNILLPFSTQRAIEVASSDSTSKIERDAKLVITGESVTLTIGNDSYKGCRLSVIALKAATLNVNSTSYAMKEGASLDMVYTGTKWAGIFIDNSFEIKNLTVTENGTVAGSKIVTESSLDTEANPNKIAKRDSSGRFKVANPSTANDVANKAYVDTALGKLGTLIEKRVIRESGPVSIPAGTKWITYIGIGGGGGGGGGIDGKSGGGGGAGGAGTTGGSGGVGEGDMSSGSSGDGGAGGAGESGLIKKVETLEIQANIGKSGNKGASGGGAGGNGGNTYVTTSSATELVIHIKNVTSNMIAGEKGGSAQGASGAPGKGTEIFDVTAGGGGAGGSGLESESGGAGGRGALIMFFYS